MGLVVALSTLVTTTLPTSFPTEIILYEHRQLYDDWTSQPFVDVILEEENCPSGYEPLFHRMWNGTHDVCFGGDGEISVLRGKESGCEGEVVQGHQPINMTSISGMTACGRRGGPPLIHTIRVNP